MRTVERSTAFKSDWKREKKGRHSAILDALLLSVVEALAGDEPLPPRFRDHVLSGDWSGCGECHLKPDLLLIYRKPDDAVLQLVRMGSHSDLFG